MIERSSAAIDTTLLDNYDSSCGSCGVYNTDYDDFTLQNQLTDTPTSNIIISELYVPEKLNETGYGSDCTDG